MTAHAECGASASGSAPRSPRGRFIVIEGGEGMGKTTLARGLADALTQVDHSVTLTREPGGTAEGEAIRGLLMQGSAGRWDPLAETLLLMAARREHWRQVIGPALTAGRIVICDRWLLSTLAYQGAGKGVDNGLIRRLQDECVGSCAPSLTLLLTAPAALGLNRARTRAAALGGAGATSPDRFEGLDLAVHDRMVAAFERLGREMGAHPIDATLPPDAVLAAAMAAVATLDDAGR